MDFCVEMSNLVFSIFNATMFSLASQFIFMLF